MDISNHIESLTQLNDTVRSAGIKLLFKVFNNVINNPNNPKYHDINFMRISKKLNASSIFIQLIMSAGFKKSSNGQRLTFNMDHFSKLSAVHNALLQYTSQNSQLSNINEEHKTMGALDTLISMGFDERLSSIALSISGFNMNVAIEHLLNDKRATDWPKQAVNMKLCEGNVNTCDELLHLRDIMVAYREQTKTSDRLAFCSKLFKHIIKILDDFNHALSVHNRDNKQFQHIYELFGGVCNIEKCDIINRHYRNRNRGSSNNDDNVNILCVRDVLDTIHCHFVHSYDIGYRLTSNEKKLIDDIKDDEKNANDHGMTKTNSILKKKREILHKKMIKSGINTNQHKFTSNLCQIQINDKSSTPSYSYSFPFNYLKRCKHEAKVFRRDPWTYSDLYVLPKYQSLKEELINNEIYTVELEVFNIAMEKAMNLKQTRNAKQSCAETSDYKNNTSYILDHPVYYGYNNGSIITVSHLLVLLLYCSLDTFQRKYTETYRKMKKDEALYEVIQRHSNYHHFGKYMKEAIEVFGVRYFYGNITRMYHGINRQMIFDGMAPSIYGPLSTTYDQDVAIQFSCNTGLIVELVPHASLKYFQCEWVSPFPYEKEILFLGGFGIMHFTNIVNSEFGWDFEKYVQPLRLLEELTTASWFMPDPADILKIKLQKRPLNATLQKLLGINIWDKRVCLALIHHELNRNGYKTDAYKKYSNLNQYVDDLLHQICISKDAIMIDWKIMNVAKQETCDTNTFGYGYIGYLFLQSTFCHQHYEGIDLDLFEALYPNLFHIKVKNLSMIDSRFLNDIYIRMRMDCKSKINYVELMIAKEHGISNISQQCGKFHHKFYDIGYLLWHVKDRSFPVHKIVIKSAWGVQFVSYR